MRPGGAARDLEFDVLTSIQELERRRGEWNQLFEASDAFPYLSYEWIHACWSSIPPGEQVYVCIARDDEGPVAAVPFVATPGLLATRLGLFGQGPATQEGAIVTERARKLPLLEAACDGLTSHGVRWDLFVAARIPAGSPLLPDDPTRETARTSCEPTGATVVIELPECYEAYRTGLSKNQRKNLGRQRRTLERDGAVLREVRIGLEPDFEPAALEQLLDDALHVCRRSWQGSADHGVAVSDPEQVDFFKAASRGLASRGMLDLSVLYVDDRPVSFNWGGARHPYVSSASAGFDLEIKSAGPGNVHLAMLIEGSIERGFTQLDLGCYYADQKRRWSKRGVDLYRLTHYARPRLSRIRQRLQTRYERSVLPRIESWLGRLTKTG